MLGLHGTAADVDRRDVQLFDTQEIERYARPDNIGNRIDCADFVELDFLRRNVVNLSLRDRELREDTFCDALRIRIEVALPDHPDNFRRLVMMVLMTVIVVMMVVVVSVVVVIAIDDDIELHRADVGTNHT